MDSASLLAFDEIAATTGLALWPATVTINGASLAATVVPPRTSLTLSEFADVPENLPLIVRISKSILPISPPLHTILIHDTRRYKIRSATGSAHESQWTLTCDPSP